MGGGAAETFLVGVACFFFGDEKMRKARCALLGDGGGVAARAGAAGMTGVDAAELRGTEKWMEITSAWSHTLRGQGLSARSGLYRRRMRTYSSNSLRSETFELSSRTAASTRCRPLSSVAVTIAFCRGKGIPSKVTSRTADVEVRSKARVQNWESARTENEKLPAELAALAHGLRVDAHRAHRAVDRVLWGICES